MGIAGWEVFQHRSRIPGASKVATKMTFLQKNNIEPPTPNSKTLNSWPILTQKRAKGAIRTHHYFII
jgi:hypothetical protein